MDWIILDRIQGHAPRTEGEKYGEVPPEVMLVQIQKHPRYEVKAAATVDHRRKTAATGEISQNVAGAADGAKLIVTVLSEVAGATAKAQQSAQTVLTASESVEEAAVNLRNEVETFFTKVEV